MALTHRFQSLSVRQIQSHQLSWVRRPYKDWKRSSDLTWTDRDKSKKSSRRNLSTLAKQVRKENQWPLLASHKIRASRQSSRSKSPLRLVKLKPALAQLTKKSPRRHCSDQPSSDLTKWLQSRRRISMCKAYRPQSLQESKTKTDPRLRNMSNLQSQASLITRTYPWSNRSHQRIKLMALRHFIR